MPTILRIGPYRFFFYSNEKGEAPHVHIQRDKALAKFWILPIITLAKSKRFNSHELRKIQEYIIKNQDHFLEDWNEHINN